MTDTRYYNLCRRIELVSCAMRAGLSQDDILRYADGLADLDEESFLIGYRIILQQFKPAFQGDFPSLAEFRRAAIGYLPDREPGPFEQQEIPGRKYLKKLLEFFGLQLESL